MDSIDEDAFLPENSDKTATATVRLQLHQQHQQQLLQHQQLQQLQQQLQHEQQHQQLSGGAFQFTSPSAAAAAPGGARSVSGHHLFGASSQTSAVAAAAVAAQTLSRRSSQSSSPATPKESLRSPLVIGIPPASVAFVGPDMRVVTHRRSSGQQQQQQQQQFWSQNSQSSPIMRAFATSVVGPSLPHLPPPPPQPPQMPPPPPQPQTQLPLPLQASPSLFRLDPKKHFGNLGRCGLRVSCLGLGTWVTFAGQVPDSVAEDILRLAYACGINFFDTAEVYSAGKAELLLGQLLRKSGWRRSSYVISTKIFWGGKAETERGLSRKHVIEGLQGSLQRLQLDYVDIVFANKPDSHTPMEEIVRAFSYCIDKGWAFYWGTSRWTPMEIMEAQSVARQFNLIPPVAEQVEYHMFQRDKLELHMPELFAKIGLGTVIWSPLACGILSGKYDDGVPVFSRASLKGYSWLREKILSEEGRQQQAKLKELAEIAGRLDCSMAQLAIAWCVKSEYTHCVLLGASSVDQLYENISALAVVPKLSHALMTEIDRILGNKPVPPTRLTQLAAVANAAAHPSR